MKKQNGTGGSQVLPVEETLLSDKEFFAVRILFAVAFFCVGLFHTAALALWGGVVGIFLLFTVCRKRKLRLIGSANGWCLFAIVCLFCITPLFGVDRGMSVLGAVRMIAYLIGGVLLFQLSPRQQNRLKQDLPYIMGVVLLLGLPSYWIEPLHQQFFSDGRYGSFIEYPNALAILSLIGIAILLCKDAPKWREYFLAMLLLCGILLTGSRTVFLLTLLLALLLLLRFHSIRKYLLIGLGIVALGVGIYLMISRNTDTVGRFLTLFTSNRTLLCRLIYWRDSLPMLLKYPLGTGFYGYSYLSPGYATALYSVRFVHNDLLQLALDGGIASLVLLSVCSYRTLFSHTVLQRDKLVLLLLLLHCLMDFDLQYGCVVLVLLLFSDLYQGSSLHLNRIDQKILSGIGGGLTVLALYTGVASGMGMLGMTELSLKMIPFQTDLLEQQMKSTQDIDTAGTLALRILRLNSHNAPAYDMLGTVCYQRGDYVSAAKYMQSAAAFDRYRMDYYNHAVLAASEGIKKAKENENNKEVTNLLQNLLSLRALYLKTQEQTSPIAWKLEHTPDFTLMDNALEVMNQAAEAAGATN